MPQISTLVRHFPYYIELLGKRLNGKGNMNPNQNGEFKTLKNAMRKSSSKEFVYIDGGANVGLNVMQVDKYSKILGKPVKIIAIEPISETFHKLATNTSCIPVNLINKALGNSNLPLKMNTDPNNPCSGSNSAINHYYLDSDSAEIVSQITLDELALELNIKHINFLKLDLEGYELNALLGATRLIKMGSIDYIQLEYNQTWIKSNSSIESLLNMLEKSCYYLFIITSRRLLRISSYHYTIEDFYYSNLLLIRQGCPLPLECSREVSPVIE